ncbi:MAG: tetratricopeptide repeat protein [Bacteroidia bacterium]
MKKYTYILLIVLLPVFVSASVFQKAINYLWKADTVVCITFIDSVLNNNTHNLKDDEEAALIALLIKVNQLTDAEKYYNILSLNHKKSPYFSGLNATINLIKNNIADYEKLVEKANLKAETKPYLSFILSVGLVQAQKYDAAITELKKSLRQNIKNDFIRITLAEIFIATNNGTDAFTELETVLYYYPNHTYAKYLQALMHHNSFRTNQAINLLENIIDTEPDFIPAYNLLYKIYLSQKMPYKAKALYEKFSKLASPSKSQSLQYIALLLSYNMFDDCIEYANSIISNKGNSLMLHKFLAMAYYEKNDFENTIIQYEYFKLNQNDLKAEDFIRWATALLRIGKQNDAIDLLEKNYSTLQSQNINMLLADLYLRNQQYKQADEMYKIILAEDKYNNKALYGLGRSLYNQKDYAKALEVFLVFDSVYKGNYIPPLWLARCNAALDPETKKGLAKPHYQNVIQLAEKSLPETKTELLEAYSYMGYYYIINNNKREALKSWQMVKQLEPNNKQAEEALKILK